MSPRVSVIAIGASAGGLHAIEEVLGDLPAEFEVPVVVVQHRERQATHRFAQLLARHTTLRVHEAGDGDVLEAGSVHVGPAGHDVRFAPGLRLTLAPCALQAPACPGIDPFFASLAEVHGPAAVAVVLSGTGRDGADGVRAVHGAGGTVIAQNDTTAEFGELPRSSIETDSVELVLPISDIGPVLRDLAVRGRGVP